MAYGKPSTIPGLMRQSLFSALSTYASSYKKSALENYTSELLAWTVNNWREFGRAFGKLMLDAERQSGVTNACATTQRYTPAGIIDLWLTVGLGDGRILDVLVENKIDAGIGNRAPVQLGAEDVTNFNDDAVVDGLTQPATQIDNYLAHARSLIGKQECSVVLLTRDTQQVDGGWTGPCWATPRRWYEVADVLKDLIPDAPPDMLFVAIQAYEFLREHAMTLEPVTRALIEGTPQRQRLADLLKEVGQRAAPLVPGTAHNRSGLDKYGVFSEWTISGHGDVGVAYADAFGDYAVYLKGSGQDTDTFLRRLATFLPDHEIKAPEGRFWRFPYVKIDVGNDFYSLGAREQIDRMVDRVQGVLKAIKAAGPAS